MTDARARRIELLVLLAILGLAALTRLPGLAERGRWDADQGTDMMVLRALAVEGELPLLGPKTSIGSFHHGAGYYYLLAPAAIASSADPVAVTGEIALFGIAAVAGAWWLGRLAGGPLAAATAGVLAAVSPAGIDESTFIWNPNLIPAAAALAYAATIEARRTGRARWWVAAGAGAMVTMQCHVLGVVIVVPLLWAWAADLRARRGRGDALAGMLRGGAGAAIVIAAGYLPLLIHELGHGFSETRAILAYLGGGGSEAAAGVVGRIGIVGVRALTWPVAGLFTDRTAISLATTLALLLLGAVAVMGGRRTPVGAGVAVADRGPGAARTPWAARWLAGSLGVSILALALFAPSLAVVTPGLPNDHYHAFLDPLVLALAGAGLARLATATLGGVTGRAGTLLIGRAGALVIGAALVAIAVTAWPPAAAPDGGWTLADQAADRVLATTGTEPFALEGIPPFKNANALRFPLERRGAAVLPAAPAGEPSPAATRPGVVVVVCDPLFDEVVGAPCGGGAEDAWQAASGRTDLALVDRFDAGSRRVISVYAVAMP